MTHFLAPIIRDMLDSNIIVGSALSNVGIGGLTEETYAIIRKQAQRMMSKYEAKRILFSQTSNCLRQHAVAQNILCESISSTAAYYSHMQLGYLNIDESMVMVASLLLEEFIRNHPVEDVFTLVFIINDYDHSPKQRMNNQIFFQALILSQSPWRMGNMKILKFRVLRLSRSTKIQKK